MFIVPVKGVYAFHLTIQKAGTTYNDLFVHIMRDTSRISGAHVTTHNNSGTGSSTALIELQQFNRVYAQVSHGPLYSNSWHGVGSIQFTGFLLYILE